MGAKPTQPLEPESRPDGDTGPRVLGSKYEVITELGHGGMADVLLAMARGPAGFNKLLVLKQIREDIARDTRFLQMLLDEARLAAQLNHPNIVQTYEVGVDDAGRFFVAMEHLEGHSLAKLLQRLREKQRELSPRMALRIAADALAGLHYAHELSDFTGKPLDVVHCDVSPHNLFVTYAGQVKLLDFGLARAKSSATHAMSGEIRGKLYYMAPEQAAAQPIDRRADIFAVGVVLWEMLTGHPLWRGQTDIAVACSLRFGEIPLLSSLAPHLPRPLLRACQKALAFRADERYPSALQFQTALEQLRSELPPQPAADEEIGALVAELFAEERHQIRKLVQEHVDRVAAQQAAAALPVQARGPAPVSGQTELEVLAAGPASAGKRRPLRLLAALVSGTLVLVLLFWWPAPRPERSMPVAAKPVVEAPGPVTRLEIRVPVPHARIYWDQRLLLGNPFRGEFQRDTLVHRVRAEAAGYQPQEVLVSLDRELIDLTLELVALPAGASVPAPEKPAARPRTPARQSRLEPPASTPPAVAPEKPAPVFEDPWGGT